MAITPTVGCQALWREALAQLSLKEGASEPPLLEQPDKYTTCSPEPEPEGPGLVLEQAV